MTEISIKQKLKIMKKNIINSVALVAVGCSALLCLWWWQATRASNLVSIPIPRCVMGETNLNVSYSVAIHKSQIRPWGTLWTATYYPNTNADK